MRAFLAFCAVLLATASAGAQSGGQLPAGHPSFGGQAAAPGGFQPPPDSARPDGTLPAGSVAIRILDQNQVPVPNAPVGLRIVRQSVAEGDQSALRKGTTNAQGEVGFQDLSTSSQVVYQVTATRQGASYASPQFVLQPTAGVQVTLHVYPVTSNVNEALIGAQGWVFIEPRDDVFQFDVLYRLYNFGPITWLPNDLVLSLPEDFKGFTNQEGMSDVQAIAVENVGVRVAGTISPGQHDVVFRFQIPNEHDAKATFDLGLPPHVAALQVEVQASSAMNMSIDGFGAPERGRNRRGQHVLTAMRRMAEGDSEMRQLSITLTGIPNPGPGRWVAVFAAIGLALSGAAYAFSASQQRGPSRVAKRDLQNARQVILDELVSLEKAYRDGKIGPKTYEQAHNALRDSLARLETAQADPEPKRSPRRVVKRA